MPTPIHTPTHTNTHQHTHRHTPTHMPTPIRTPTHTNTHQYTHRHCRNASGGGHFPTTRKMGEMHIGSDESESILVELPGQLGEGEGEGEGEEGGDDYFLRLVRCGNMYVYTRIHTQMRARACVRTLYLKIGVRDLW